MRRLTPSAALIRRVLQRTRTVAIVGTSSSPDRHSYTVTRYLARAGFDVIPVWSDRSRVAGLGTYATLMDVPGPVDLVVVYRTPSAVPSHIAEAAAKQVEVVWLPPGTWSLAAEAAARQHGVTLIKDRCIMEEHRRLTTGQSGHPPKWGVHVRRRKPTYEDNRKRPDDSGYTPAGGGGRVVGGGGRAILGEKKMKVGAPSKRSGPRRRRGQ